MQQEAGQKYEELTHYMLKRQQDMVLRAAYALLPEPQALPDLMQKFAVDAMQKLNEHHECRNIVYKMNMMEFTGPLPVGPDGVVSELPAPRRHRKNDGLTPPLPQPVKKTHNKTGHPFGCPVFFFVLIAGLAFRWNSDEKPNGPDPDTCVRKAAEEKQKENFRQGANRNLFVHCGHRSVCRFQFSAPPSVWRCASRAGREDPGG